MKQHLSHRHSLAAIALSLAAIFMIIGCGADATPEAAALLPTAQVELLAAPTLLPPPPTPSPSPTAVLATLPPAATAIPALPVTPTSAPTEAVPTSASRAAASVPGVTVSTTTVTLPTYPIWDFLIEQVDPLYNIPVFYFNRAAYEAAGPQPAPKDYAGVVLENAYLRLVFLPELGGRLYSAVIKATGQEIFYHNPVIKPSRYGVLQPYEANWWLAAGGMEWAYPTQEHGYRFGVPWQYTTNLTNEGATITLSDMAEGRVGAEVTVTLPPHSAYFTVAPRLVNGTSQPAPVQFWSNAALTLGAASMSPQTQFILPSDKVIVHSRGESGWTVPGERQESTWPLAGQTDLSLYRQWANYLGFFVPNLKAPFIGAYNPETDVGIARLIEPGQVPGTKLFAFSAAFPDKSYTDDGSQYFELWGGANRGFWPEDDVTVPPGGAVEWQEGWWPLPGLGGLTWANANAAIHVSQSGDAYTLSLLPAHPITGKITILSGQTPLLQEAVSAAPNAPGRWTWPASPPPTHLQLTAEDGSTLLDYQFCKDC